VGLALRATLPWNVAEDADGRFAAVAVAMGEPPDAGRLPATAVAEAMTFLDRAAGVLDRGKS